MAGGNEAQHSDRIKLLKNKGVFNSWVCIRHEYIVLGLFHAVTALRSRLPCFFITI
ncbi:MAG: hypothetical protein LBC02_02115 [Planctomycetaceae bacterium]|nr:hypothetical protein [Planctomycetaceae bacterium]